MSCGGSPSIAEGTVYAESTAFSLSLAQIIYWGSGCEGTVLQNSEGAWKAALNSKSWPASVVHALYVHMHIESGS